MVAVGILCMPARLPAADVPSLLSRLQAVGREGAGNAEAARAWRELVQEGPAALLPTLSALDGADATAANWLRAAVDAIAERELAAGRPLAGAELEGFVRQIKHSGRARRLAYEWLTRVDPSAPGTVTTGHDRGSERELRRDAVELTLQNAQQLLDKGDKPAATAEYRGP